jgi:glycerophosphoryl diester phosphodiesterase
VKNKLNITAHSGCDGTKPDSIESIHAGIRNGADAVEVDVRLNAEGMLVLSHDEDETHRYTGHVTLADVFELAARDGRIAVNCDVKEREAAPVILRLAAELGIGPGRLILTGSSTPSMLAEDPGIVNNAIVWLNVEEIVEDYYRTGAGFMKPWLHLIDAGSCQAEVLYTVDAFLEALVEPMTADCLRLGVGAVNMPYTEQTASLIPRLTAGGMQVSVWTINEKELLERVLTQDVLNITTRESRLALEIRRMMSHSQSIGRQ